MFRFRLSLIYFFLAALIGQPVVGQSADALPPVEVDSDDLPGANASAVEVKKPCCNCGARRYVLGKTRHKWSCHLTPALQYSHWGYPEHFYERPFGVLNRPFLQAQIRAGAVEQLVLFQFDFHNDSAATHHLLNRRGEAQLRKMSERAFQIGQPIVIQESEWSRELDEKRRETVVAWFAQSDVPETPVFVGRVPIAGLGAAGEMDIDGQNARNAIQQNRLRQTSDQGRRQIQQSLVR